MAYTDNAFQFNNEVVFNLLEAASNSLATSARARPYDGFNYVSTKGDSRRLAFPQRLKAISGIPYNNSDIQSLITRFRRITVDAAATVPISVNWQQTTFDIGVDSQVEFANRFLIGGMRTAANLLDYNTILDMAKNISDTIGDPSQPMNGLQTMSQVNTMFMNMGLTHYAEKYMQLSPNATGGVQTPYATYFNQPFNTPILEKDTTNFSRDYSGIDIYATQNYYTVTNGVFDEGAVGNITVSVAPVNQSSTLDPYSEGPATSQCNSEYATLTLTGFAASTSNIFYPLNRIYFDGATPADAPVFMVNPDNYRSFSVKKTYVVISDANGDVTNIASDGSGNCAIRIFPPVLDATTGVAYQEISRPIAIGDVVGIVGGANTAYDLNFCYVKDAVMFANPPVSTSTVRNQSSSFAGFPFIQVMQDKIPNSELSLSFTMTAVGNQPMFTNEIAIRSVSAAASYTGFGFAYASKAGAGITQAF